MPYYLNKQKLYFSFTQHNFLLKLKAHRYYDYGFFLIEK
jgi:hypothetical protein